MITFASTRERNHSRLRHSSRNLPLKLSVTPFCQGLPCICCICCICCSCSNSMQQGVTNATTTLIFLHFSEDEGCCMGSPANRRRTPVENRVPATAHVRTRFLYYEKSVGQSSGLGSEGYFSTAAASFGRPLLLHHLGGADENVRTPPRHGR